MKTSKPKKPQLVYPPLPPGSILLTLDVSSTATGYAVGRIGEVRAVEIIEFGIVKPVASWVSLRRITYMRKAVLDIAGRFKPTEIFMEWQSWKNTGKRVQGLAILGQSQGVVYSALSDHYLMTTVSERDWVRLNGKQAKKETRCDHVKAMVPEYAAKSDDAKFDIGRDAADAIGLLLFRVNQGL